MAKKAAKPTTRSAAKTTRVSPKTAATKKPAVKKTALKKVVKPVQKPEAKSKATAADAKKVGKHLRRRWWLSTTYALGSFLVLLGTTVFWALLGARVQQSNADQLINVYLFQDKATFHGSLIPSAHSFLIKWPLFWLVHLLGSTERVFVLGTVALAVLTVGCFALILYRIDRRSVPFGSLCLALASVLLLVPAQPYAGALLPVNMAMLTTRNIEYIVYIISLGLLISAPRLRNYRLWLSLVLLSLLFASDKLFLTLSLGGAGLALVMYILARRKDLVRLAALWLGCTIFAGVTAMLLLWALGHGGVVHITGQPDAGPYRLIHSVKDGIVGAFYSVFGLLTNFGANPAVGTTTVRSIPHQAFLALQQYSLLTLMINFCVLVGGFVAIGKLLLSSLRQLKRSSDQFDHAAALALALFWTTVAAFIAFIGTKHEYAVDARYLSIAVFAIFVSIAVYIRAKNWRPKWFLWFGTLAVIGIGLGLTGTVNMYHQERAALAAQDNRNAQITQALLHHSHTVLVGDYWRVVPTKANTNKNLTIVPMGNCTQMRQSLTSTNWQPDLNAHSFAYLLSLEPSLTDYPNCNLDQVIKAYGRPNTSTLIEGTLSNPGELLLFYDNGANKSAPSVKLKTPSTVLPIDLKELPNTGCDGSTVMNVVAHQDDDLLFMNPDLKNSIRAGECVRTVYVTAGDDGSGSYYWLSREQGAEAAYSTMLGANTIWVQRIVKLGDNHFVTVANPRGNSKISLVFMHLPDGNLLGQGFHSSHNESLRKLLDNKIPMVHTVDNQSLYTAPELTQSLTALMNSFKPDEVRTQTTKNHSTRYPDHSDHLATGVLATLAYANYVNKITTPIIYYIGYPVRSMPPNETADDISIEESAFLAYAQFDLGVCHTQQECKLVPTYNAYLQRQYKTNE